MIREQAALLSQSGYAQCNQTRAAGGVLEEGSTTPLSCDQMGRFHGRHCLDFPNGVLSVLGHRPASSQHHGSFRLSLEDPRLDSALGRLERP
jgi:hypothetical protein